LEVVHCAACPWPTAATSGGSDANPASMRDQLDQAARVAGLRGCQIAVRASVAEGSPAEVLVERSRGAAVLVLGCHDPGPPRPPANESLSDYCRLNAFCPVTVVDPASLPDHH
ncbi:MAG: universal stress protein, partial [Actinomycetota bacterium]|nr:universal stress protein [Actinomycetota bacterium]